MSTKLSFFDVPRLDEIGIKAFAQQIVSEKFTARTASGFLIDRQSNRSIEGRYVQRFTEEETFVDPLGKKHRQETLYYVEQKFLLRDTRPQLVVFDSNASLRPLTGRLSEFSGFRIAIEGLNWSPEGVLLVLAESVSEPRVYAAKVEDVRLSASTEARITCESAGSDIRADVRSFLRKKDVRFACLKIEFDHAGLKRKCEIRHDGVIQIYGDNDPAMIDLWIRIVESVPKKADQIKG